VTLSPGGELEDVQIEVRGMDNEPVEADLQGVTDVDLPTVSSLSQNIPNPFNPMTTIRFNLSQASHVSLCVYDIAGHLVQALVSNVIMEEGPQEVVWRGCDDSKRPVSAGVYFYRLTAGGYSETKRMVLVK